MKNKLFLIFLFSSILFQSCEQRKPFCECVDIGNVIDDAINKSPKELEKEMKGCEWIKEELSLMEIASKTKDCYSK